MYSPTEAPIIREATQNVILAHLQGRTERSWAWENRDATLSSTFLQQWFKNKNVLLKHGLSVNKPKNYSLTENPLASKNHFNQLGFMTLQNID